MLLTILRGAPSIGSDVPKFSLHHLPATSLWAVLLAIVSSCGLGSAVSSAQETESPPGIRRFALPESGLVWRSTAHPQRFFEATGRRAGAFGKQSGVFEAWIYPMKLLHGCRVEFRQEGMVEPVRGEALLEQVVTRPESTTLIYVAPSFTVRQTIWVPLEEPALVIYFDVDSDQPLVITLKFTPDFKPMWPASFGGQHSYWIEEEKAFGLTDGTGRPTALVGSSAVAAFTDFTNHQLIGGEMLLQFRILPDQARAFFFPVVMAFSMDGPEEGKEVYRRVLGNLRELYETRVRYHREFLARTVELETPEEELNRALAWAKVAIDAGWVCHPTQGCGLVAGYGPSGEGERPGFAWWFGGDALMASWTLADYGDLTGALQALRFLKARQRADGKMLHEMTQSVDLIDWFGQYGFAYYHADTTPMYLYSLAEYWRRTGDRKFIDEFWESAKRAYTYCVSTLDPGDGLMDNTKAGLAAIEVGPLRGSVVKDIYLQGFWVAGLEAIVELAGERGEEDLRRDASARLAEAPRSLATGWWNSEGHYYVFGLTAEGRPAEMLGAWPAVLFALPADAAIEQAAAGVEAFARPELATDWGTRWLSNTAPLYDPTSYNNGSVWPFMSGLVALAQFKHNHPVSAFATWSSVARLTGMQSPGAMPEHMVGDRNRPGERSVPHQLFSSVGVLFPAVRGLLGLRTDAAQRKLWFHPRLPAHWPHLRFSRFPIGTAHISGEVRQQPGRTVVTLEYDGEEPLQVDLQPLLPTAAQVRRVLVDGHPVKFAQQDQQGTTSARVETMLARRAEIIVEYQGGIGIVPVATRPEPGQRTTSLKILRVENSSQGVAGQVELTVAGLGGHSYVIDLVTQMPSVNAEGASVRRTPSGYRLELSLEGSGYVIRKVGIRF